jgi:hypothetical protein
LLTARTATTGGRLDRAGVVASLVCALHCALTPMLIGLLPLAGLGLLADERTEWVFIAAAFVIGALSLLPSYARRHRRPLPLVVFTLGAGLILGVRLVGGEESKFEIPAVAGGALLIAAAHLVNHRLCLACPDCRTSA